jgi:4,5-DOPA dioxygenase extradiol
VSTPALFVGHGSPMNAIEDNAFRQSWSRLGRELARPRAILCVSAHWEARGVWLTGSPAPPTIHDFYGFPPALYAVRYAAPGAPQLAQRTASLLYDLGARLDPERGLDHGCWSVLVAMYPDAEVPVLQLSLDTRQPAAFHYDLARRLAPLREEGVLVLGSGNVVHNLRQAEFGLERGYDWAERFDAVVRERIRLGEHQALVDYPALAAEAPLAVPTPEHYLPLLYALALQRPGEPIAFFNEQCALGSISMTSVVVGVARGELLEVVTGAGSRRT